MLQFQRGLVGMSRACGSQQGLMAPRGRPAEAWSKEDTALEYRHELCVEGLLP